MEIFSQTLLLAVLIQEYRSHGPKCADVKSVFKTNTRTYKANYRPVNLLPVYLRYIKD